MTETPSDAPAPPAPGERARPARFPGQGELVGLVAGLMALNAVAIDIMLPAFGAMDAAFGLANDNDRQLVVIVYMAGLGVAQLFWGPVSDRFGRRNVLFAALGLYAAAGAACLFVTDFSLLLAARALQGVGAAATRVIAVSVVRDLYSGRSMAKIMSLAMTIFMAAPILAPSIGQAILFAAPDWRMIFGFLTLYGLAMMAWSGLRLPETLTAENRQKIDPVSVARNYAYVLRQRETFGYMIAAGFVFGGLFSFIATAEQTFHGVYGTGSAFPLYFACIAGALMAAAIVNARLVERLGMRRLSHGALVAFLAVSAIHAALSMSGPPPLAAFMALMIGAFFFFGFIGANFNAIAMEPLGAHAGVGAAVYGFVTTAFSAALGGFIGRQFDGGVAPMLIGHASVAAVALLVVAFTERGRLFGVGEARS